MSWQVHTERVQATHIARGRFHSNFLTALGADQASHGRQHSSTRVTRQRSSAWRRVQCDRVQLQVYCSLSLHPLPSRNYGKILCIPGMGILILHWEKGSLSHRMQEQESRCAFSSSTLLFHCGVRLTQDLDSHSSHPSHQEVLISLRQH